MFFDECTHDRIIDMSYLFDFVSQERGTILLAEGKKNDHFYIIDKGTLKSIQRRKPKRK